MPQRCDRYQDRTLDIRPGTLNLPVPKRRQGSYFPGFLAARKTSEQALVAVIRGEADQNTARGAVLAPNGIGGVSTRRVDELVRSMRLIGISKPATWVSRFTMRGGDEDASGTDFVL